MTTLADLRQRCQEESDNVGSSFIQNSEWTRYINGSYGELYGLLATTYGTEYFIQSPSTGYTFTTDGINQLFALPADFFKLSGVDVMITSPQQWIPLKRFMTAERDSIALFNTQIPAAGQTVRLLYVPRLTNLVSDGDTIADAVTINQWEEYIVADACIKALGKEESDVSVFMARKGELKARLESEAANRDAANPTRIIDMRGKRARSMQYQLFGSNIKLVGGQTPGWAYDLGDWGPTSDGDAWGGF